ncbi:hypothetical protein F4780DRAFT_164093 [Xylariomycetidae sp. FL0641]|nr:hypothetical protein F4780DRAFT_164093 [Xylariomycetidae sp. FL0641]
MVFPNETCTYRGMALPVKELSINRGETSHRPSNLLSQHTSQKLIKASKNTTRKDTATIQQTPLSPLPTMDPRWQTNCYDPQIDPRSRGPSPPSRTSSMTGPSSPSRTASSTSSQERRVDSAWWPTWPTTPTSSVTGSCTATAPCAPAATPAASTPAPSAPAACPPAWTAWPGGIPACAIEVGEVGGGSLAVGDDTSLGGGWVYTPTYLRSQLCEVS